VIEGGLQGSGESAIALDGNGNPLIAYEYDTAPFVTGVRLVRCGDPTCATFTLWNIPDSDLFSIDKLTLSLDNTGVPVIIYHDIGNDMLYLAHCDSPTTCNSPTLQPLFPAIQLVGASIGADGLPVIVYATTSVWPQAPDFLLRIARCNNATTCNAPAVSPVDAVPYSRYDSHMTLSEDSGVYMAYVEGGRDDLRLAYCASPDCPYPEVVLVDNTDLSGFEAVVKVNARGDVAIVYTRQPYMNGISTIMLYTSWAFNQPGDAPQPNYYTTHQPTLTWSRISGASGYFVSVQGGSGFMNRYWVDVVMGDQLETTTDWLENGTYYWQVQAIMADGTGGTISAEETFVIAAP
jgi:hypothetical protein